MAKKMTVVEKFARITAIMNGEIKPTQADFDFIDERVEIHTKKNASRKPTATQKANAELGKVIVEFLKENGGKMTITEMIKSIPECADLTNQKVSAIVRGLVTAGDVEKTVEKGKSLFSAVVED